MPRHAKYLPNGVIPAILLPFDDDLVDRRARVPQPHQGRRGDRRALGAHHQCALDRGRLLHVRRAAPRARHRAGRDRRQTAAGARHLGRRQSRGGAHRQDGGGRRRLRAAGVSAGAVHDGAERRDGDRAFQAHRRRDRPAADRVPVSARDRPGLSEGHAAAAVRRGADDPRHQGLVATTCRSTSGMCARCNRCRAR